MKLKKIKIKRIQNFSNYYIPYQNKCGHWVWRHPDTPEDTEWPGIKSPEWATIPIYFEKAWRWFSN